MMEKPRSEDEYHKYLVVEHLLEINCASRFPFSGETREGGREGGDQDVLWDAPCSPLMELLRVRYWRLEET